MKTTLPPHFSGHRHLNNLRSNDHHHLIQWFRSTCHYCYCNLLSMTVSFLQLSPFLPSFFLSTSKIVLGIEGGCRGRGLFCLY